MTVEHAFCIVSEEADIGYYDTHTDTFVPTKNAANTIQGVFKRNSSLGVMFDAATVCCACQTLLINLYQSQGVNV